MSEEKKVYLDVDALREVHDPTLYDVQIDGKVYKVGQRNVVLHGIMQSNWFDIAEEGKKARTIQNKKNEDIVINTPEYYEQIRISYTEMCIAILKEFNDNIDEEGIRKFCKHNINAIQDFVEWYNGEFQKLFLGKVRGKHQKQPNKVKKQTVSD